MMDELKTMPFGAVWDMLCVRHGTPAGMAWIAEVERHERDVLSKRV